MRPSNWLAAIALCSVSLTLGSCAAMTSIAKLVGLQNPPPFIVDGPVDQEFAFTLISRDASNPATDYTLRFSRSGWLEYRVNVRKPVRFSRQDRTQVPEDTILALWKALQDARFPDLDEHYESSAPQTGAGVRTFWASIGEQQKRVEVHYTRVPELDVLQAKVLALVPKHILSTNENAKSPNQAPDHYVGDRKTNKFYASDDEALEEIPEERRVIFRGKFDALDHGFHPISDETMKRPEK